MSLAEQSQQWYPTSVQVTVLQARNLRVKGKNGTNDAFAIIQVAKEKFSTAVAEKSVAPVWKEEATFDLPLFHRSNADRCTLYIIIMHRALGGLDKQLGQAIVNLVDLQENPERKKTDWYKLVDKHGKADKDRGEVLLDIQFMRNNMTASMFDLSMQDKPRSRISKLKDKVRGKKKDSDSVSAIVPSSGNQVLTDSEEEGEDSPGTLKNKKSSKLKSLFGPKTNLHKGISQSMSTLGTLPEKNSSLSGSRSSGLNVEGSDGKGKLKFLGHKRNGSTDSKVSLGPFSLLSRSKQSTPDNNMCINGSHVYTEEQEPKANSGSTLSLSGSAKGSVEDLRKYHERNASTGSADSFRGFGIPSYKPESTEISFQVPQRRQEDEEKSNKKADGRLQEVLAEQERKKQQEQEARKKKQEEDERKMQEVQERRRQEEAEQQRKKREEEAKKAEELKRQEESRVSERLTNLFGLGKKKEPPSPPAVEKPKQVDVPPSTNPFEEIPLGSESSESFMESSTEPRKDMRNTFTPTALPRTAKVSAVKPRFTLDSRSDTDNTSPTSSPVPSDIQNNSPSPTSSSNPFATLDMFSNLHSAMAPPKPQRTFFDSQNGSIDDPPGFDLTTGVSEKKRTAPQAPSYPGRSSGNVQVHSPTSQQSQRPSLPLPDYDVLFPKKRHGVMTDKRWEHIIAEVNQRKMNGKFQQIEEEEVSVDGPNEPMPDKPAVVKEKPSSSLNQHHRAHQEASSTYTNKMEPKETPVLSEPTASRPQSKERLFGEYNPHLAPKVSEKGTSKSTSDTKVDQTSGPNKEKPIPTVRSVKKPSSENSNFEDDTKGLPSIKPRQQAPSKELAKQAEPEETVIPKSIGSLVEIQNTFLEGKDYRKRSFTPLIDFNNALTEPVTNISSVPEKKFIDDPFPNDKLFSQDPWAFPQQNLDQDDLFTGGPKKANNQEPKRLTADDFDNIFESFGSKKETDPFFASKEETNLKQSSTPSQKVHSQRKKQAPQPPTKLEKTGNNTVDGPAFLMKQTSEDVELTVTSIAGPNSGKTAATSTVLDPFTSWSSSATPELPSAGGSGGKSTLFARVSPSEVQSVTSQSAGGGGVLSSRRPHPVKPMSPNDGQSPMSILMGKDLKATTIREVAEKGKTVDSGPFSQLTQEELITLVVKQQAELTKKDEKIIELEQYIDNLLVRVIEEKPNILLALGSKC